MQRYFRTFSSWLIILLAFLFPIEHKYDKLFRHIYKSLIPPGAQFPWFFAKQPYFHASDLLLLLLTFGAFFCLRISARSFFCARGALCLYFLLVCTVFSIIFSPLGCAVLPYTYLLSFLSPFLLFSLMPHLAAQKKLIAGVLCALIAASAFQCVVAILQYVHQGSIGLRLLGENSEFSFIPLLATTKKWIFDAQPVGESFFLMRPSGTLPHANALGGFLCVSLFLSYGCYLAFRKMRPVILCLIPLQFFSMCLSLSRSALFTWVLTTVLWVAYLVKKRGFLPVVQDRSVRSLLGILVFSAAASFIILAEPLSQRGGIVNYNRIAQNSDTGRIQKQKISLRILKENPFFGAGFQQTPLRALEYPDVESKEPIVPHNIFLYIMADTGVFAGLLFVYFIAALLLSSIKRVPYDPIASCLLASFVALLSIGLCDFYPVGLHKMRLLFFFIASLLALYAFAPRDQEKIVQSWKMFDHIHKTYDRINSILSFGTDRSWRRFAASFLPQQHKITLLDIASGTGEQLISSFQHNPSISLAFGIDLSEKMLCAAEKKLAKFPYQNRVVLRCADAENLPFENAAFDAITLSFGIRNFAHPEAALAEMHRTLRAHGRCIILEFSLPQNAWKPFYLIYLRYLLPVIGGCFSRHTYAYRYLNKTIETFPYGETFVRMMQKAGFQNVFSHTIACGSVTVYVGEKHVEGILV